MNIVFGFTFESDEPLRQIEEIFKKQGIVVDELIQKNRKSSVEEYIFSNRGKVDVLIIDEYLESVNPYLCDDIMKLVELDENMLVIPVIDRSHKGGSYVTRLFNMGVFNAVYSETGIDEIAELILKKRSRVASKLYYGISTDDEVRNEQRANIPRLIEYIESRGNDEEKIIAAFEYVKKRLSDTDFALLCDRLSDRYISVLWEHGLYQNFIGHRIEAAKKKPSVNINIGGISIKGGDKEKVVYKEIANEIIAVVSPRRKTGSTFVALNLAKLIADSTGVITGYVHLPDDGRTYNQLGLGNIVGNFKSHLQEVLDSGNLSEMGNIVSRVAIICENPDKDILDGWSFANTLRVLYQSPNPTVLDMGMVTDKHIEVLSECDSVITVFDEESSIEEIVKFRDTVLAMLPEKCRNSFVFNHSEHIEDCIKLEGYVDGSGVCIELPECRKSRTLYSSDPSIKVLLCGTKYETVAGRKKDLFGGIIGHFKDTVKAIGKNKRISNISTVEIAVGGVSHGSGCTYMAVMIASSIAKRYRTAYFEANNSGHMECLDKQIKREIVVGGMKGFPYAGVDYYYGVSYSEFASEVKDQYDFVIVDYGTDIDKEEYLRAGKRIITMVINEWRMDEIDLFSENVLKSIDAGGAAVICVPFRTNKELGGVRKLCPNNAIVPIPFCSNPFLSGREITEMVNRIIGTHL